MNNSVYHYLITNRAYNPSTGIYGDTIAAGGALTFLMAQVTAPSAFKAVNFETWGAALEKDLQGSRQRLPEPALATFFVHGFGVSFDDARTDFATYFTNLASDQLGGYPGVLIGFDWPSNVGFQMAKKNAQATAAQSFPHLATVVRDIRLVSPIYLGAICHSMGNYLMYEGASQLSYKGQKPFDEILCIAAMLEVTAFNSPTSMTYGQDIVDAANRVTIYSSIHDDVLPAAEAPELDGYPELGIYGPGYDACLLAQVVGVGCSAVVNEANAKKYETGRPNPLVHIAYFFIPETLKDISQTLLGASLSEMTDRRPIAGTTTGFMLRDKPKDGAAALAAAAGPLPWAAAVSRDTAAAGDQ